MATLYEKFKEFQTKVNSMETDYLKADKGNDAAARRVRTSIRDLKPFLKEISDMTKTIGTEKS